MLNESERIEELWKENVVEDEDDIISVLESAAIAIERDFGITLEPRIDDTDPNRKIIDPMKIWGTVFIKTYEEIKETLRRIATGTFSNGDVYDREPKESFAIDFCGRCEIGFGSATDPDDEKEGNFMIYIVHKNNIHPVTQNENKDAYPIEMAANWNMIHNVTDKTDIIRVISEHTTQTLKDEYDFRLQSWEYIPGIFCTIYDAMINFLKIKQVEEDVPCTSINWLGCFRVTAQDEGEGTLSFIFTPSIESKLDLKDDSKASATKE